MKRLNVVRIILNVILKSKPQTSCVQPGFDANFSGFPYSRQYLWYFTVRADHDTYVFFLCLHSKHVSQHPDPQVLRGSDGHLLPDIRSHTGEFLSSLLS